MMMTSYLLGLGFNRSHQPANCRRFTLVGRRNPSPWVTKEDRAGFGKRRLKPAKTMLDLAINSRQRLGVNAPSVIRWILVLPLAAALHLFASAPENEFAARVLVLANSRQPESVKLAEFYAEKRSIPKVNVIALPMPDAETISWRDFLDQIYNPLQKDLVRKGWIDATSTQTVDRLGRKKFVMMGHHISYLVTCRGVPLRIANDSSLLDEDTGRKVGRPLYKDEAAVDSELSLLAQSGYEITGTVPNPFFGQETVSVLDAGSVVKVSRLDGPTFESAQQLVTSALEGERTGFIGRAYVDLQGPHPDGDKWLQSTLSELEELGFDAEAERTGDTFDPAARFDAPAFYFGWYANDLTTLGKLLDDMPNVVVEFGAVIAEIGRQPRMAKAFFTKYQDRIMFGKDSWVPEEYTTYFRVLETDDEYFPYHKKYHAFWRMYGMGLPDNILKKIYYKNALRVIPGLDKTMFPD